MTFQVTFNTYGDPIPKGRPRFTRQGRAYTPKRTLDYESEIAEMAKRAMGSSPPLETPVTAYVYVTYTIPPSYSKKRADACLAGTEKPKRVDLDNVCKAVFDACNGIIYVDDSQIVNIHARKTWGHQGMVQVLFKEELP